MLFLLPIQALTSYSHASDRVSFTLEAQFTGTLPGDPTFGDAFGSSVTIPNADTLIVAAGAASPPNADFAGAAYFFSDNNDQGQWQQSQPPVAGTAVFERFANIIVSARNEWLFVPVGGTPLGQPPQNQDSSGVILVYKFDNIQNQYVLVQELANPDGVQINAQFGYNISYNGGNWMVAGGAFVNKAYFFNLNNQGVWEFAQSIPLGTSLGYVFPAINGTHAMACYPIPGFPDLTSNGQVAAFELQNGTWVQIQTLAGVNNPMSEKYGSYDTYGEFIGIDGDSAIISAPQDNQAADVAGAVYFYQFDRKSRQWQPIKAGQNKPQNKVWSDKPSCLFGFGLAIKNGLVVIGDCGRTIGNNIFQGAGVVYQMQNKNLWKVVNTLLTDPQGRAYDFLGGGGVDINAGKVSLGDDTFSVQLLPSTFPGVPTAPASANLGRALLWSVTQSKK